MSQQQDKTSFRQIVPSKSESMNSLMEICFLYFDIPVLKENISMFKWRLDSNLRC